MTLKEKIDIDIKTAMKARETVRLDALRAIKAAILNAQTEKGSTGEINSEQELKILQKLLKQRKEAATIFIQQNRNDLADVELEQATFIENYLPKMMDEETLKKEISTIINELGISDPKDFGRVMGAASKKFAGQADNKMISDIVKQLLS
jgi:uncharacterized protein